MNSRAIGIVILFCVSLYHPAHAAQNSAVPRNRCRSSTASADRGSVRISSSGPAAAIVLLPSDVIELTFPYVPEFDQTITVQPDGYASLRGVGDLRVQSRTLARAPSDAARRLLADHPRPGHDDRVEGVREAVFRGHRRSGASGKIRASRRDHGDPGARVCRRIDASRRSIRRSSSSGAIRTSCSK